MIESSFKKEPKRLLKKSDRFLLCRPQGGLNDILCQIEKCCRYAERTNRVVIVDTMFSGSRGFGDHFANYFKSIQPKLFLAATREVIDSLKSRSTYPPVLQGILSDYRSDYKATLKILQEQAPQKLFLATDSALVLTYFRDNLKKTEIFSFAQVLSGDETPLHANRKISYAFRFVRNQDAVLDLLMLGCASQVVISKLIGRRGPGKLPETSGFSRLGLKLYQEKVILKTLVKRDDNDFGLH